MRVCSFHIYQFQHHDVNPDKNLNSTSKKTGASFLLLIILTWIPLRLQDHFNIWNAFVTAHLLQTMYLCANCLAHLQGFGEKKIYIYIKTLE